MNRRIAAASLAVFCFAAAVYGVPRYRMARETARRQQFIEQAAKNEIPLVLDAKTQAILSGADRVETFRLVDDDEDEDDPGAPTPLSPARFIDQHQVLRVGPVQSKAFAEIVRSALAKTPSLIGEDGLMSETPSCFEPGFAFRAWKGKASMEMCVCFHCGGVQIVTHDPRSKLSQSMITPLGSSRPLWLALSKQAFPHDTRLAALPTEL